MGVTFYYSSSEFSPYNACVGAPRILIVDDSVIIHSIFKATFARVGNVDLSFAKNGKEALEHIAASGAPSLIFLDVNMPVMNGLDFLGHLRDKGLLAGTRVVIVSTEGRSEDVQRGLDAGASAYVLKPFRPEDLSRVLREQLGWSGS
jgi:two-component system, chemotaxis family, chemotaxis protein CheY